MKKIVLTLGIIAAFSGMAYADGNAFTPLNFNDTEYGNTVKSNSNVISTEEATGNGNIQNAIQQLDNAQIDIRNELLNVKTKYADVDAQYKLIKTERATLKKQVRAVEKRIKELDKAKEKIRKNML
jgi:chromosome segregation ATPase